MNNTTIVSQTAMLIASLRALACYEEDPLIHGNDYMAKLFLPEDKRSALESPEYRPVIKGAIPEGLYDYVLVRTKYYDDLFSHHLELKIPQIVLLGAGYDSRPYRFRDRIQNTKIYEVDAPATQKVKRQILSDNAIEIHPNVMFISVDFEQKGWFQSLLDKGFQQSLKTLYIWEGVTFYLAPTAVDSMLRLLKQHSSKESILSFDYQHKDSENPLIETGLKNENIQFGLNTHTLDNYLQDLGYTVLEKLNSEAMGSRFLTTQEGKRLGSVKPMMHIVTAQMI